MTDINQNNRIQKIKELMSEDAENSFLEFALAKEYEKSGDIKLAIEAFEKLKARDPDYNGLYYQLAILYKESDNIPKAISTCDEGIEICQAQTDMHALSELKNLRMNIEID